jgi:hypothetical protein
MTPSLIIGGVNVSVVSWLDFNQSIEPISGASVRRMTNGAAFKMGQWRKYRISLSASGWVPPPLLAVNYDASFVIELPFPVSLNTAESLPSGWSSRSSPWTEKTITDQDGKSVRIVYPKMTVIAEAPSQRIGMDGVPSWEFVCEDV